MAVDNLSVQKDAFVSALRVQFAAWWATTQTLLAQKAEENARGWSGDITTEDIAANNYDLVTQDVSDALGSIDAIETLLGQGHATNITKMIKR